LLGDLQLPLPACLRQLAPALQVGMGELFLGGLAGLRGLADLLADQGEPLADLVVAERGDLRLELVGFVDQGLDPSELAVVRVDESGKEFHGPASIWSGPVAPSSTAVERSRGRA